MRELLQQLWDALDRGRRFVTHDVWRIGVPGEAIPHGFIIKHIRVAILLVKGLLRDDVLLRASALTFATMLAIVPFLALMFFIIETFNVAETIDDLLSPVVGQRQADASAPPSALDVKAPAGPDGTSLQEAEGSGAVDASEQVQTGSGKDKKAEVEQTLVRLLFQGLEDVERGRSGASAENPVGVIVAFARRGSNSATLWSAGGIFLVATVFGLMMNIEYSFNRIWGVRRGRSWYRMFSDYVVILLLLPFMVAALVSVAVALKSSAISQWPGFFRLGLVAAQYAVTWFVFTALYFVVPNTRVRLRYALLAGVLMGTVWSLLSMAYVNHQFGLDRYMLLYSAFAQVPVFLMWLYCSWVIVLAGAELAFAYQNERTFAMERFAEGASYAYRETLAIYAMTELGKRFDQALPGLSAEAAANEWNVPTRLLNDTLSQLEDARLVVRTASNPPTYQPSRSLDKIRVDEVIRCLRESGRDPSALRQDAACRSILKRIEAQPRGPNACTIAALVAEHDPAPPLKLLQDQPQTQPERGQR